MLACKPAAMSGSRALVVYKGLGTGGLGIMGVAVQIACPAASMRALTLLKRSFKIFSSRQ